MSSMDQACERRSGRAMGEEKAGPCSSLQVALMAREAVREGWRGGTGQVSDTYRSKRTGSRIYDGTN